MEEIIVIILAYLFGSIPFGYLLVKISDPDKDIRKIGSGNVGATNVKRALGWAGALIIFLLDMLKGAIPIWLARDVFYFNPWIVVIVGIFAIGGHLFPIFLSFHGGKGVSTAGGIFLVLNPIALVGAIIVWAIIYGVTKYSSLGSLLAAATLTTIQISNSVAWGDNLSVTVFTIITILVILYKHQENIERLLKGQEKKA